MMLLVRQYENAETISGCL